MNRAQLLINEAEWEAQKYAANLGLSLFQVRAYQVGMLEGTVRQLCEELEAVNEPAKRDPSLVYVQVDHSELGRIWLGCDYTPETADTHDEPGDREDFAIIEVWVGGRQIGAFLEACAIRRMEPEVLEAVRKSLADAEADARMEAA